MDLRDFLKNPAFNALDILNSQVLLSKDHFLIENSGFHTLPRGGGLPSQWLKTPKIIAEILVYNTFYKMRFTI